MHSLTTRIAHKCPQRRQHFSEFFLLLNDVIVLWKKTSGIVLTHRETKQEEESQRPARDRVAVPHSSVFHTQRSTLKLSIKRRGVVQSFQWDLPEGKYRQLNIAVSLALEYN